MTKKTALYESHKESKAKIIEFSGYLMPVWFDSIKSEHIAVRKDVGVFDISHMGIFKFTGDKAFTDMQYISCNNLKKIKSNKLIYSMILNHDGNILDDVMFTCINDEIILVVNASNKEKIQNHLRLYILIS